MVKKQKDDKPYKVKNILLRESFYGHLSVTKRALYATLNAGSD